MPNCLLTTLSCNSTRLIRSCLRAPELNSFRPEAERLELDASFYQILQILSLTLFEKTPILCALQAIDADANFTENVNQLILFNF